MDDGERWVVVVSPRGDVVRLDEEWGQWEPATLFACVVGGRLAQLDTPVTVNGSYISLCWREAKPDEGGE